ncbi:MAG: helix-turn-helix transcriptional regulator [Chloroflexota bacterium]|nr:helix-turn-helix transcriptional regulator [Chloroflexota bacterium]
MNVQIIERNGNPEWAIVPHEEYLCLVKEVEMLQDIRDYNLATQAVEQGEEAIPSEVMYAILDGESPVRVWREYRGLIQLQVSEAAGISKPYLSQIETGKRTGTIDVLAAIAAALDLALDDIIITDQ